MSPWADLLRKHGIARNTFFKWRSKYGGATVADVENAAIKDVLNRKL